MSKAFVHTSIVIISLSFFLINCEEKTEKKVTLPELEVRYDSARNYWRSGRYVASLTEIKSLINEGKKGQDHSLTAKSYFLKGYVHLSINEEDSALGAFLKARASYLKAGNNEWYSNACSKIAVYLIEKRKLFGAEPFVKEALKYAKIAESDRARATANVNYALWFSRQGQYDSAFLYYERAKPLEKKLNRQRNLADLFIGEGFMFLQLKDYRNAELKYAEALVIGQEFKYNDITAKAYYSIGIAKLRLGEVDESIDYLRTALDYLQEVESHRSPLYNNLGEAFLAQGQEEKAALAFRRSLVCQATDGKEIEHEKAISYKGLAQYHELKNNTDSVKHYEEMHSSSLQSLELHRRDVKRDQLLKNIDIILALDRSGDL